MKPRVGIEFGVEGDGNLIALAGGDDVAADGGDGLRVVGEDALDVGCADEGHRHVTADAFDAARGVETA